MENFSCIIMAELQHRKILKTFSNIIKLFHCSCSFRADCKIMRLFFLSACVPSRIIRSRYFFTLDVLRRMSCYFCIVTVKRGCYDRHRAPFCGFPRRENHVRDGLLSPSSFLSPLSSFHPPKASDPAHAYLTFNGRRKFSASRLLFSGISTRLMLR